MAFDFGTEVITAQGRIGARTALDLCWEAPAPAADGTPFCATEEAHALVLEALAVMHFPNVDTLVLGLPAGEVDAQRERLAQAFTRSHELRNTECRSQRLVVTVRRVSVVPREAGQFVPQASGG